MSSDDYRTDQWILDLFPNFYDPCPYLGLEDDEVISGLNVNWNWANYDGVFVNPPYSNPKPWVKKAIQEHKDARRRAYDPEDEQEIWSAGTIVMLLKHDTSTEWYRLLHEAGAKFLLVNGRLKHQTNKACAFPSVLVVMSL
jgi:hypothetical protein